jgi:hypothetical protein
MRQNGAGGLSAAASGAAAPGGQAAAGRRPGRRPSHGGERRPAGSAHGPPPPLCLQFVHVPIRVARARPGSGGGGGVGSAHELEPGHCPGRVPSPAAGATRALRPGPGPTRPAGDRRSESRQSVRVAQSVTGSDGRRRRRRCRSRSVRVCGSRGPSRLVTAAAVRWPGLGAASRQKAPLWLVRAARCARCSTRSRLPRSHRDGICCITSHCIMLCYRAVRAGPGAGHGPRVAGAPSLILSESDSEYESPASRAASLSRISLSLSESQSLCLRVTSESLPPSLPPSESEFESLTPSPSPSLRVRASHPLSLRVPPSLRLFESPSLFQYPSR